jgi:hypothetical protein
MHVCMHVCKSMHACMEWGWASHLCMCACMHVACIYVCMYVCKSIVRKTSKPLKILYTNIQRQNHMCICVCICMHVCKPLKILNIKGKTIFNPHKYTNIYINTYIYIHTYIYIYTCICTRRGHLRFDGHKMFRFYKLRTYTIQYMHAYIHTYRPPKHRWLLKSPSSKSFIRAHIHAYKHTYRPPKHRGL